MQEATSIMNAALYMRVSGLDQSTDNQLPQLQRLAESRGLTVVRTVSERITGTRRVRPGLTKVLVGAHAGEFQVLIVWAIDRLGRTMHGVLETVQALDAVGCKVVSLQEPWLALDGPVRPLLLAIFAWVAEQERTRLVERTRAGLQTARARGVQLGRPRVPVDRDRALELRRAGASYREAARLLGVSVGTLHSALRMEPGR